MPPTTWSLSPDAAPRSPNALVDDPDWCGHAMVDRHYWACATCGRPCRADTRLRLTHALGPTDADHVWLVTESTMPQEDEAVCEPLVLIVTRRAPRDIPALLVRSHERDSAEVRQTIARCTWVQGVYNDALVFGYDKGPPDEYFPAVYTLSREPIVG